MQKTKVKNDEKRLSQRSFTALWASSYAALWMVLWALLEYREYRSYAFNVPAFVIGITVMTFLTATFQRQIAERYFKRPMGGWILASVLGSIFSVVAFGNVPASDLLQAALALILPISLVQMAWLWRHVKSARFWPLINLLGIPLFILPFRGYEIWWESGLLPFLALFTGGTQGVIQAVVMRHLWAQPREKAKQQPLIDEADDHNMIERLSLNETAEEIADEQPLTQQKSR